MACEPYGTTKKSKKKNGKNDGGNTWWISLVVILCILVAGGLGYVIWQHGARLAETVHDLATAIKRPRFEMRVPTTEPRADVMSTNTITNALLDNQKV